ncbi:calnexin-like protein [Labeo rohita]|uniref:Calnexin-like protein n=1 Tax=Labeo rohita TaxID=84645 RepID=A0A498LI34_LABRO|nr:calnexin-like protein [Labeo rohita]RXN16019.1 calnexin-like protein [Labeo rohita]
MRCVRVLVGFCLCLCHSSEAQSAYRRVAIPEQAYFAEPFDGALDRNWVLSKAVKDDQLQLLRYNGEWVIEDSREPKLQGNRGLVLKSPGKHHAISAYLRKIYHFTDKPLCLQYEVFFRKGVDCGGAYLKLLSHSDDLRLSQFSDATPYTIMFGPDKCGSAHKIHFIFRHRNPVTGAYEEKHARQPEVDLTDYFTDQRPHLYTLNVYPDYTFEILVDLTLINKGSLLEDMDSPVSSPHETQEHADQKSPKHGRSDGPFTMSPVSAVGFELLSLTGDVMFDNILVSDSLEVARRWTEDTWGQRKTPGMIEKLLIATVKRPWLWGVYVVTVGLPIILFISLMWPDKRFGPPDQDYYYKKTDEPQPDRRQNREEHVTPAEGLRVSCTFSSEWINILSS